MVPVDLAMLGSELESDLGMSPGGFADLCTGDVSDESSADPMRAGQDTADDVPALPDRWLRSNAPARGTAGATGSPSPGRHHTAPQQRLERAIEGTGMLGRFHDLVDRESLTDPRYAFSTDRQLGRARQSLADEGILVG